MLDLTWPLVRPLLFQLSAERAHELTLRTLARAPRLVSGLARTTQGPPDPSLGVDAFGLRLGGPVGLAAGLDKNGVATTFWPSLGFGFIEVGTVTAHPQPGNPQPRLFRLPADGALINRMGFNNGGSQALADRLRALHQAGRWPSVPVGANIGKSKITPLDQAPQDYATSTERLAPLVDWFTVNVSSPNTPGLRSLQEPAALQGILGAVLKRASGRPVLLKLAPDLAPAALAEAVELAIAEGVAGIIATNTTVTRDGLRRDPNERGGLSGRPLWPLARSRIQTALDTAAGRVPIIGCGGIHTTEQVEELLTAGCVAVQIYTGLIFEGPGLPSRINRALAHRASGSTAS
ncbi:MAG: quinone-dependent dihydroorotate dehydrogenase [Deltaproteobacteria bacterium]|nr:MAG: quinone-dependent dihydroorotate dehydrogenase [Deltaproteobacteria bacterium]